MAGNAGASGCVQGSAGQGVGWRLWWGHQAAAVTAPGRAGAAIGVACGAAAGTGASVKD